MEQQNTEQNPAEQKSKVWPIILAVIITAVIVGGGVYYYLQNTTEPDEQAVESTETETAEAPKTAVPKTPPVIEDLEKGKECIYKDPDPQDPVKQNTLAKIKGDKIYMNSLDDTNVHGIVEEDTITIWSMSEKKGYYGKLSENPVEIGFKLLSKEMIIWFFENQGECVEKEIDDSIFQVPLDIPLEPMEKENETSEITFDGCGQLTKYQNQKWYPAVEASFNTEEADLSNITDACFSENGDLFVMLIPGGYSQGPDIYRFNTDTYKIEKATLEDKDRGWLASPDEFGKRVGEIIELKGTSGDAGAGSEMYFEYDFAKNTVELIKEYNFSADDPDNGTWHYY